MLIEEILRTCANRKVAEAAVSSIGRHFSAEIRKVAAAQTMTAGEFAADAVSRFARSGDEAAMRSVVDVMHGSQQPVLDGLRRILCLTMAAEDVDGAPWSRNRLSRMPPPYFCALDHESRREMPR